MPFYMLHPRELNLMCRQKNTVTVDIRDRQAYQKYHFKNAINIPYVDCENWSERFRRGQNYILYCDYGNISLLAAKKLAKCGITVYTVVGGAQGMQRYFSQNERK